MGYSEYFARVKKKKINPLRKMDNEQLLQWCIENGIEVEDDGYVNIHDIFTALDVRVVYEFGKYYENSDEIVKLGKRLFKHEELHKKFGDYNLYVVGKEAVECAIEWQRQKIVRYYETLALDDEEYAKIEPFGMKSKLQRLEKAVVEKKLEWGSNICKPYNLNENSNHIVNSWLYEYTIFELVRIYKDTNWNTECLIFYGK